MEISLDDFWEVCLYHFYIITIELKQLALIILIPLDNELMYLI